MRPSSALYTAGRQFKKFQISELRHIFYLEEKKLRNIFPLVV